MRAGGWPGVTLGVTLPAPREHPNLTFCRIVVRKKKTTLFSFKAVDDKFFFEMKFVLFRQKKKIAKFFDGISQKS